MSAMSGKHLHVRIDPSWQLTGPGGQAVPARALAWLADIQAHGSLSAACKAQGASYRHAWALLREAEAALGAPLVDMTRGKGAALTPLGEALVWSQRRGEARLRPQLDSLAHELHTALHRLLADADRPLRVAVSHGYAIETLQQQLAEAGAAVDWRYTDSSQALAALHSGAADVASLHLPIAPSGGPGMAPDALQSALLRQHQRWLAPDWLYVHMVTRRQGLMVRPGNPLHIDHVADLLRPDVRFVPRVAGSGTRLLLEALLRQAGHEPSGLGAGTTGEHTHAAVAAFVASGMADAGFGVETSARRFGLEFIPVQTEQYGLLLPAALAEAPGVQRLLGVLRGAACQAALSQLGGYSRVRCGEVEPAAQVFAGWPLEAA